MCERERHPLAADIPQVSELVCVREREKERERERGRERGSEREKRRERELLASRGWGCNE